MPQIATRNEVKEAWIAFYNEEQLMLDWFKEHAVILHDFDHQPFGYEEVTTIHGVALQRPPKFIRKVVSLNDRHRQEALSWLECVQGRYRDAIEAHRQLNGLPVDDVINYPERFPVFLEPSIEQINYSIIPAIQSVRVPRMGDVILVKEFLSNQTIDVAALMTSRLSKLKPTFPSARLETDAKQLTIQLLIDADEFHAYAQTERIQRRHQTGDSYRARFYHTDGTVVHGSLGFLVTHSDQSINVFASLPRKKRTDTIPESAVIKMPIDLPHKYIKKD